jgi:hypothetical protein
MSAVETNQPTKELTEVNVRQPFPHFATLLA